MKKPTKDELLFLLLLLSVILLALAVFVLFFEKGLPWIGQVIRYIGVLLSPFLIAWLLAVITRPVTQWFIRRLHLPPTLAVLLLLLVILALVFAMVWLVVAVLSSVLADLAYYTANLEEHAQSLIVYLQEIYHSLDLDSSSLQEYIGRLQTMVEKVASDGMDTIFSMAKATPGLIFLIIVAIVATFYWCREEYPIRNLVVRRFPSRSRQKLINTYDNISGVLGGYVRAQLLLISISLCLCVLGFTIIGAERPIAMGLFAGAMDIIPVLGPGTLIVPWAVWCFVTDKIVMGVGLLIVYAVVSGTRYVLEPKVVGDRIGLHPLAALAAIFIGMKMFGLVGLILGPIVLAVLVAVIRNHHLQKSKGQEMSEKSGEENSPPHVSRP